MNRIAVIGAGISGLTVSYLLSKKYQQVSLFEANNYFGGHTHTHEINFDHETYKVDSGFIVFNKKTYPNFIKLLNELNIRYQESEMSFGVYTSERDYYYTGRDINSLFAQRRNILNPKHWLLLYEILRFNRTCLKLYADKNVPEKTLGEFLIDFKYAQVLENYYILPMVSAIWSSGLIDVRKMPLKFFIQFFVNHCLFNLIKRPMWYTITNGSSQYIAPMLKHIHRTYLGTKIAEIYREGHHWCLNVNGECHKFDTIIFACHADTALGILKDRFSDVSKALQGFKYQENQAVLHYDSQLLPPKRQAIAAWNYLLAENSRQLPTLTYHMNTLQSINANVDFCVSLNPAVRIDPKYIFKCMTYTHPVYTEETLNAQQRIKLLNGSAGIYFCGSHLGNGFHEDGVISAINVAKRLGVLW